MPSFNDHFSGHAAEYRQHRPSYPAGLFSTLAELAPARTRVWDCGTGNGQAAVGLAAHFDEVIATDASRTQVENAEPHERVRYAVAPAENSGVETASCDMVTVAQALHWFDHRRFFDEVRRVLRPRGVFVAWSYRLFEVAPDIDAMILEFYDGKIGPYWPPERAHVDAAYRTIELPFLALELDEPTMHLEWTSDQALAYLATWSASKKYLSANGTDPLTELAPRVTEAWGPGARSVNWPVTLVGCRKPAKTPL